MTTENIDIVVTDKVSSGVSKKLREISSNALHANNAVERLKTALLGLNTSAIDKITSAIDTSTNSINKNAIASQKLATEINKTNAAYFDAEAALNKAIAAETKAAAASQSLAVAQQRTATAATQASTAAQNLAAATTKAGTAQTQASTAAQRLATEQQRTAVQASNAAAASDRAALAALRLQQAKDKAAAATKRAGSALASYAKTAVAAVVTGLSAGAIVGMADAYTNMQNKLQNVTETQEQVNVLTNRLFDLANKTRSGVEETTTAFTRFDRALKNMGKSQEDTLRMTETVNKALIISGATTQESASSLLQLSQAFNAGKLQGDEFRAIAENMPIVLDAVAKATGKPIEQVKKMSTEGKITAQVLYDAFKLIEEQVDKTFDKTKVTASQAFQILSNESKRFIGELDKLLGITSTVASAVLFLADNLKALTVVAATVGTALIVYFGPALAGAFATATKAVLTFTAALALNPIGLLAIALTAVISALAIFRNDIKLSADGLVTLGDYAKAAMEIVKEAFDNATKWVSEKWNSFTKFLKENFGGAVDWIGKTVQSIYDFFANGFGKISDLNKKVVNSIIAAFVITPKLIEAAWNNFPGALNAYFVTVYNFAAESAEKVLNVWSSVLNKIADWVSKIAPNIANSLREVATKSEIKLPRVVGTDAGKQYAEDFKKIVKTNLARDFLSEGGAIAGGALNKLSERARKISEQRRKETDLRGASEGSKGTGDGEAGKLAAKRADIIETLNRQLDGQISRAYLLKDIQEQQAEIDKINEQLLSKKLKTLSPQETEQIKSKVSALQEANRVGAIMNQVYEDSISPQRTFSDTIKAIESLLKSGAINQDTYNKALNKAKNAYEEAIDPMRQYKQELQDQMQLSRMTSANRAIEQQLITIRSNLIAQGYAFEEAKTKALEYKATLEEIAGNEKITSAMDVIIEKATGQAQAFDNSLQALKRLQEAQASENVISAGVTDVLKSMGIDTEGLQVGLDTQLEMYRQYYAQLEELKKAGFLTDRDYSIARAQLVQQENQVKNQSFTEFFSGLASLQNSNIKELAAAGKAAAIAQATINTYEGATKALAQGGIMGPVMAAIIVANGLSQVAQIRSQGFKKGGYTGSVGVDEVAGVVHGREFVMDAETTSRIGVSDLQALQSGAATVQRPDEESSVSTTNNRNQSVTTNNTFVLQKAESMQTQTQIARRMMIEQRKATSRLGA